MSDLSFASTHRRVRWAMYGALFLLAAAIGLVSVLTRRADARAEVAVSLLEFTTEQRARVQRIGRVALALAQPGAEAPAPVSELMQLLDETKLAALQHDDALATLLRSHAAAQAVHARWWEARDQLWQTAERLLRQASVGDGQVDLAQVHALAARSDEAFATGDALTASLRAIRRMESASARDLLNASLWLTLALLGALVLGVVEPTGRAVRRAHRRMAEQAGELERLALVAERTSNLVIITDRERRIEWVNEAFVRSTGYTLDEARGRKPSELLHSERTDEAALTRLRDALERGEGARAELLNRGKNGRDYWVDIDIRPFRDAAGTMTGFVAVETDITERVQQRRQLEALLAALPDGVLVIAGDGRLVEVNPAAERLLGLTRDALLGQRAEEVDWGFVNEDLSGLALQDLPSLRTLADGRGRYGEVLGVQRPGQELRWLLVNTEALPDAIGERAGVVTCLVDITDRRRLQDRLAHSARVDALTELPNRIVVTERIERALEHRRRHPAYGFAVLFMDFDRFKQVNDTHGHGIGDQLLQRVAQRLLHALRPGDAIARMDTERHTAARLGGDEFVVVLEGIRDEASVHAVAARLLEALTEPYVIGRCQVQSGVSIGVVIAPEVSADADSVLRDADTAMYEAKRSGRGRYVVFHPSMHERVAAALGLENDLRQALRRDELFVVYQPVMHMERGQVAGVEALVRWRHPTRGLVPPADFVPLAEEVGLIAALGDFVLDAALEQFADWRRHLGERAPATLAVNLSRAQLRQNELVPTVRAALARSGVAPGELHLEVTESLAAQDGAILARMRELKALGVHLALDDFGTGYSSLACLHQMPIDTVKIDRSFVAHAETSSYHRVVIEATLRVAKALGMASVAEGIESEGQALLMSSLGCILGQGYHYGRPLEAAELTRWLSERPVPEGQLVDLSRHRAA